MLQIFTEIPKFCSWFLDLISDFVVFFFSIITEQWKSHSYVGLLIGTKIRET
jgi:hypothetical protein